MDVKKIKVRSQDRYEWKRRTVGEKTVHIIACIILGIFAASYVIAFLWGVLSGAKSHRGVVVYPFEFPGPDPWQWTNYIEVFSKLEVRGVGFIGMVSNTLLMVAASPLLSLGGTAMFAYVMTKYKFPFRNALFVVNTIVITLPIIGTTAANYRLCSSLGMIDSPLFLISSISAFGSNFLYMSACFKGVSTAYMEAARIDGAGHWRTFLNVMMPQAMGMFSALWILQIIGVWNDSGTSLLYWPNMPTLATGIYLFSVETTYDVRTDILIAGTIVSAIPPFIVFCFFHKKLLTNVTFGGLKG